MRLKLYKNEQDLNFLRKKSREVDLITGKIYIKQLLTALHWGSIKNKNPIGLASNQIGLTGSVFIAKISNKWRGFINPEVVKHSKEIINFNEGCLSLKPNKDYRTKRYKKITIKFLDDNGVERHEEFSGFDSIVIQHEIDHLKGKLCKDGGINKKES
tara:strand:- start:1990 stop:2460 length:471 start_codon:yes stop_codon:yes gene_type:complete